MDFYEFKNIGIDDNTDISDILTSLDIEDATKKVEYEQKKKK